LSHSFNNNKLDDRDHFQQNAKTSVASLRGLIGSSRNTDRHHSGMLIDFIGIPTPSQLGNCAKVLETLEERCQSGLMGRFAKPLYGLKPVPGVRIPTLSATAHFGNENAAICALLAVFQMCHLF